MMSQFMVNYGKEDEAAAKEITNATETATEEAGSDQVEGGGDDEEGEHGEQRQIGKIARLREPVAIHADGGALDDLEGFLSGPQPLEPVRLRLLVPLPFAEAESRLAPGFRRERAMVRYQANLSRRPAHSILRQSPAAPHPFPEFRSSAAPADRRARRPWR